MTGLEARAVPIAHVKLRLSRRSYILVWCTCHGAMHAAKAEMTSSDIRKVIPHV